MKHLTVIMLALLLICGVNLYAQGQFGIYGLLSLPSGDFADDNMDDEKSGLAKTGFGGGAAYTFPLVRKVWAGKPMLRSFLMESMKQL